MIYTDLATEIDEHLEDVYLDFFDQAVLSTFLAYEAQFPQFFKVVEGEGGAAEFECPLDFSNSYRLVGIVENVPVNTEGVALQFARYPVLIRLLLLTRQSVTTPYRWRFGFGRLYRVWV